MERITLGSTNITSIRNGFGALPIQRVADHGEAARILQKAYRSGITFFDTARSYTDSEEKLGLALADVRGHIHIATKTGAKDVETFWQHLETSLKLLRTEYIDIYQFHNAQRVFRPGDGSGMYEAMLEAKERGLVRHIGITSHKLGVAQEAVDSGLYETLQFPLSYLSGEKDLALARRCRDAGMGFIAMKALSGGLITSSAAAYSFFRQYDYILPIWGIQHEWELDEFIAHQAHPPALEDAQKTIRADREELSGNFCRSCGYCLPCPQEINIPIITRSALNMRRMPPGHHLIKTLPETIKRVDDCISCGSCSQRCPYDLDVPALLRENQRLWQEHQAAQKV